MGKSATFSKVYVTKLPRARAEARAPQQDAKRHVFKKPIHTAHTPLKSPPRSMRKGRNAPTSSCRHAGAPAGNHLTMQTECAGACALWPRPASVRPHLQQHSAQCMTWFPSSASRTHQCGSQQLSGQVQPRSAKYSSQQGFIKGTKQQPRVVLCLFHSRAASCLSPNQPAFCFETRMPKKAHHLSPPSHTRSLRERK